MDSSDRDKENKMVTMSTIASRAKLNHKISSTVNEHDKLNESLL